MNSLRLDLLLGGELGAPLRSIKFPSIFTLFHLRSRAPFNLRGVPFFVPVKMCLLPIDLVSLYPTRVSHTQTHTQPVSPILYRAFYLLLSFVSVYPVYIHPAVVHFWPEKGEAMIKRGRMAG